MQVAASYFDGISARRQAVTVALRNGMLEVLGDEVARQASPTEVKIPGRLGNTPRQILFADGAHCEIADHLGFEALLAQAGYRPSLLARLEDHWRYAAAALLITLLAAAAAYLWGLPYAAREVAVRVPVSVLAAADTQFMRTFDHRLLLQSELTRARRQAIQSRLDQLSLPPGVVRPTAVYFRRSPSIGPNAFALPGGSVVILDEIVALADDDEEILAVLAHELGHVAERHALRQMLQASVVGLVMAWYVGDVSSVLAVAPATLLETRYSRDFERRADALGASILAQNGIPTSRLTDMLEKLDNTQADDIQEDRMIDYLSTHPATAERIRSLRGER